MREFFGILFVVSTLVQLYARWNEMETLKVATKAIILPALIGWYFISSPAPRLVFILALAFGWLGDILLLWPKLLTYGGFSFFFGHMFYIASFWRYIAFREIPIWQYLLGALFYATVGILIIRFVSKSVNGKTRYATTGYVIGLTGMSFCALLQCLSLGSVGGVLMLLGSLFFIVSDFNLLIRSYRPETRIPKKQFVVMLTYAIAQALLVSGMLQIEQALV